MSSKYKFVNTDGVYFVTATVVDWVDVFTRDEYRDILMDSFRFCQEKQGLRIYGWVLMTNHLHLICSSTDKSGIAMVMKNIKSFTAMKLINAIINNPKESRKGWMLDIFEKNGLQNKGNQRFQFWQHENHPILLDGYETRFSQRLQYLHENPVRAGFVALPQEWKYSSATDFYTTDKGLLDLAV
jgi:REP element-mobilizing transposase RayT